MDKDINNINSDNEIVGEHFAVVFVPRKSRGRFPENCVDLMESEASALKKASPDNNRFAAKVVGPSRSSEGCRLYYLVHWLE